MDEPIIDQVEISEEAAAAAKEASSSEAAASPATDADALAARIVELEKGVESEKQQYLRTLADFQNYRRRVTDQMAEDRLQAVREMAASLFPVLDNFERAVTAAEGARNIDALLEGLQLTRRQLLDAFSKHGIEPILAKGMPFDPTLHEAIASEPNSEVPENTIIEDIQRGYRMGERVIRASLVKVSTGS